MTWKKTTLRGEHPALAQNHLLAVLLVRNLGADQHLEVHHVPQNGQSPAQGQGQSPGLAPGDIPTDIIHDQDPVLDHTGEGLEADLTVLTTDAEEVVAILPCPVGEDMQAAEYVV